MLIIKMNKIKRYIIFDAKEKLFCIRESEKDIKNELENKGYKVIDYTDLEIKSVDIELYESKGFRFDNSGSFLNV